mmetsp:Transcript_27909/g.90195  ORF Transcript_27909/g.90195 Transcript_27909/m.90195 type:complete len:247 (-) Transcript_27909:606-1346(-)
MVTSTSASEPPALPVSTSAPARSARIGCPPRESCRATGTRLAVRNTKRSICSCASSSASDASASASSGVAGTASLSSMPITAVKRRRTKAPRTTPPLGARASATVLKRVSLGVIRLKTATPDALTTAEAPSMPGHAAAAEAGALGAAGATQAAERRMTTPSGRAHSKSSRSATATLAGSGAQLRGAAAAARARAADVCIHAGPSVADGSEAVGGAAVGARRKRSGAADTTGTSTVPRGSLHVTPGQ